MGGAPLNRNSRQNNVEAISEIFQKREIFRIAIAHKELKKKISNWKTVFYYIAFKEKVLVIPIVFDCSKK